MIQTYKAIYMIIIGNGQNFIPRFSFGRMSTEFSNNFKWYCSFILHLITLKNKIVFVTNFLNLKLLALIILLMSKYLFNNYLIYKYTQVTIIYFI